MRAEEAGARTWLSAGFAGWAACLWILAMFGMGGSIDRLDDDPALRQALPAPVAPADERPGPLADYGSVAARPLFTDNRRPQPFLIDPTGETDGAASDFDYVLTSVLRTPQLQMVILQPAGGGEPLRVRQGAAPEPSPRWVLQTVDARSAVFAGPEGERRLELRVFDGTGGQAPTPMLVPQAPAAAVPPAARPPAVADAGMPPPPPPRANGAASSAAGAAAPAAVADAAPAAQPASDDQIEMIRRRIEERRARLRQGDPARANQANENQ